MYGWMTWARVAVQLMVWLASNFGRSLHLVRVGGDITKLLKARSLVLFYHSRVITMANHARMLSDTLLRLSPEILAAS